MSPVGEFARKAVSTDPDELIERLLLLDAEAPRKGFSQRARVAARSHQRREESTRTDSVADLRSGLLSLEHDPRQDVSRNLLHERLLRALATDRRGGQLQILVNDETVGLDDVEAMVVEDADLAISGVESAEQRRPQLPGRDPR